MIKFKVKKKRGPEYWQDLFAKLLVTILCITSLFFILWGCAYSMSRKPPKIDQGISAIAGGDYTALVEGCGNQLVPGYTYCRKEENQSTEELIYFLGPKTNCKKSHCVEFKIFYPDGSPSYGDAIPRNKFRKAVPWSKLVKRDTFQFGDTGFWPFYYKVYWRNEDGHEGVSVSQGEIRLRVIKKNYLPLHEILNDDNFTWKFQTRNCEKVRITLGMRTFVGTRKVCK